MALIVNHENITQNWYVGNDRSMLVCNCLFRLGGAGALLSNRFASLCDSPFAVQMLLSWCSLLL